MSRKKYNPNSVAIPNGNYFAFPYEMEESNLCLISIPWDVTTSYGGGTAKGPEAILDASGQLDFFNFDIEKAWELPCATIPINQEIISENERLKPIAKEVIIQQEKGVSPKDDSLKDNLKEINQASKWLNDLVEKQATSILNQDKIVGLIGGDHSTPYGLIKALTNKHESFGILHIDAHADLRKSYEGFKHSHASIMYNIYQFDEVEKIIQVGIRDVCEEEINRIETQDKIKLYDDNTLSQMEFEGQAWGKVVESIIAKLPEKVYISFDIDGLDPSLCPNTGTPVPGGLSFNQAIHLLRRLHINEREIIGFDICEVSNGNSSSDWDANVGARILYQLCCITGNQFRI